MCRLNTLNLSREKDQELFVVCSKSSAAYFYTFRGVPGTEIPRIHEPSRHYVLNHEHKEHYRQFPLLRIPIPISTTLVHPSNSGGWIRGFSTVHRVVFLSLETEVQKGDLGQKCSN